MAAGRERARYWTRQWHLSRLPDARTFLDHVYASHAAEQLGITHRGIRSALETMVGRYSPSELLGFDPRLGVIPKDLPEDCACGRVPERGRRRCRTCRRALKMRSNYDVWYQALIAVYFLSQYGLRLPVSYANVLDLLPALRPYPRRGTRHHRDAVYAVTHIVYTQNHYNRVRVPAHRLRLERAFLKASIPWAIEQGEPDTVAEIIDSLAGCGVADSDPLMVRGRTFLLAQQQEDGGWGDEHDAYGRFHSVWTCIDGLRDYRWQRAGR